MAQKLYKTALKGDICKQAISMLNVSGMFFIASGVSLFFSLPRKPPPLPKLSSHSCKMAARNGKRSISMILRKKEDCEQTTVQIERKALVT